MLQCNPTIDSSDVSLFAIVMLPTLHIRSEPAATADAHGCWGLCCITYSAVSAVHCSLSAQFVRCNCYEVVVGGDTRQRLFGVAMTLLDASVVQQQQQQQKQPPKYIPFLRERLYCFKICNSLF